MPRLLIFFLKFSGLAILLLTILSVTLLQCLCSIYCNIPDHLHIIYFWRRFEHCVTGGLHSVHYMQSDHWIHLGQAIPSLQINKGNERYVRPWFCTITLYWPGSTLANEINFVMKHAPGATCWPAVQANKQETNVKQPF